MLGHEKEQFGAQPCLSGEVSRTVAAVATNEYFRSQMRRMAVIVMAVQIAWGALIVAILSFD